MITGKIIKGIGGFYYVESADTVYECKARGSFRQQKMTPLVGDNVEITVNDGEQYNSIDKILLRKNALMRPPLANIDRLFILASVVDPALNTFVIDKLAAIAEYKKIEPVIVITKTDLDDGYRKYEDIYRTAGFQVIVCDNTSGAGADEVKALLTGKVCAFTGNTGVGKSTLLNNIFPHLALATGETSKKLGRGKHTTRHCELFKTEGGYIADTPGFSSMDFEKNERILKEDLPWCFREFRDYLDDCRFANNCAHVNDKGCAVVQAVRDGAIAPSRHDSYVRMYQEVKEIKEWQIR